MLPQDFKGNYLSTKNAMRISRKVGVFYMEKERCLRQLAFYMEQITGRSFLDCTAWVEKQTEENKEQFFNNCKKFAR